MAVTTCLTFELVVLKRGKSTLEEGMLFPWLIDWLTPPSLGPSLPGPPGSQAGLFATDDGLSNLLHQPRGTASLPILQCARCGLREPRSSSPWAHSFPSKRWSDGRTGIIQSRLFSNWYQSGHWTFAGKKHGKAALEVVPFSSSWGTCCQRTCWPKWQATMGAYVLPLEASAHPSLLWLGLFTVTLYWCWYCRTLDHSLSSKDLEQFPKSILSLAPRFWFN